MQGETEYAFSKQKIDPVEKSNFLDPSSWEDVMVFLCWWIWDTFIATLYKKPLSTS